MRYDYECPSCGWKGEKIVNHFADADKQKCSQMVDKVISAQASDGKMEAVVTIQGDLVACDANLQRAEMSGVNACMGMSWGAWNGTSGGHG